MDDKPKLRAIEAFPVQTDRGTMVCLRDASGLSDRVVTASPQVIVVLQMLDGAHGVLDIQAELTRRAGRLVDSADIRKILGVLDEALLLEGERFEAHRARLLKEFADSPVRRAASAGHSYPDDPAQLRKFLDEILAEAPAANDAATSPLRGLIAPHIDHVRGRKAYAAAYSALAGSEPADLYVLLGTAHAETTERFVLTRKDFETPLGRATTDKDFVDALAKSSRRDLFADEFAHRSEHSIELELVFVQHLAQKAKRDFTIAPILCGGYAASMEEAKSPSALPGVKAFLGALRKAVADGGRRVCVIAGADLAHVGPRFGTPRKVTKAFLRDVERADRESLAFVEKGDAEGFAGHVALDRNARNVCGVGPVYAALKALEPCAAELLGYEQWADDDGSSSVTFAAAAIR